MNYLGRVGGVQEIDAHARIIKRQLCTYLRGESVRVSRRSLLHQSIIQHSTTNECALSHFSSPFLCPSERQHPLTCRQRLKASLLMRSQLQVKSRQSSPEWCVMCVCDVQVALRSVSGLERVPGAAGAPALLANFSPRLQRSRE